MAAEKSFLLPVFIVDEQAGAFPACSDAFFSGGIDSSGRIHRIVSALYGLSVGNPPLCHDCHQNVSD
ncbi:hypothetical protein [Dentiradicibacter hellwigii]|uniref:Porphobilinogen synthase n=1 Tax=Dentiradicibacter hellwigii TaxID=3149053 RepID=A0ABV4UFL9_9RHOO